MSCEVIRKPVVGSIVHVFIGERKQPEVGIVTRVWSDACVNLWIIDEENMAFIRKKSVNRREPTHSPTAGSLAWDLPALDTLTLKVALS